MQLANAKIKYLQAEAEKAKSDVDDELSAQLTRLETYKRDFERQLSDMKTATERTAEDLGREAKRAWQTLDDAIDGAGRKLAA